MLIQSISPEITKLYFIRENDHDIGHGNDFMDMTPKQ
jgi:hypothetical protein